MSEDIPTAYVYILGAQGTARTKIGRTKGAIADRIAQLQTGNPFVIVERDHIATNHASKVESYLHALLATSRGRTGEWFELSDDELQGALGQAREYAAHLEANATELAALAAAPVEQREEAPTDRDRSQHLELLALYAEKKRIDVEIEKREDALKLRIGAASGLESIASWKLVEGSRLDQSRLKRERPELYDEFAAPTASRRFVVSRNVGEE